MAKVKNGKHEKIPPAVRDKVVADYVLLGSKRAAAKENGISESSVRRIIAERPETENLCRKQQEKNTVTLMQYMASKTGVVCEIIGKGLDALNDSEKLKAAAPSQITTALGTLIDKFAVLANMPPDEENEDALTKSLRQLGTEIESDRQDDLQ